MKIIVIGGGAAGMMAAITAAKFEYNEVTLLERNKFMGIKLNITGKGRCNVTNNCDLDTLMKNTVTNGRFLYSAYSNFTPQDGMEFFEELGVPLKTERGNRVFPVSDRAKDITEALQRELKRLGIKIRQCRASEIITEDGYVKAVRADRLTLECDRVILATGGLSYPKTGSSGDGFHMAKELGHTVTDCTPSLVSLALYGDIPARLEGLSLRNIKVTMHTEGKKVYDDFGEMLFTEKGVSGPVILSMSAHYNRAKKSTITIDLKPALDEATLDKRILRDFEENINRDFVNSVKGLLPAKMIPVIVELSGIEPTKKVNEITKKEREGLVKLLKNLTFDIVGTGGYNEAVVTKGGISVKEISPKTMESKLVGGLYFAGEIIDVDAYTGGFNLQIAWSTAYAAGMAQEW